MTKISQYSTDVNITGNDKWIGSDAQNFLITKNFTPNNLANYFNENNVIDIGASIRYRYQTLLPGEAREQGTISFETEIGPQVNFSAITTFLIAKNTLKGNTVSQYLDFLVDSKVLLSKASNINIFGYYKITSIEPWIPNTDFFVVEVDFLAGNGFIYEDLDYLVSLVDKAQDTPAVVWGSITGDIEDQTDLINYISSELTPYFLTPTGTTLEYVRGDGSLATFPTISVGDLQSVTDEGNTTTNNIQFIDAAEVIFGAGGGIFLDNSSRLREGTIDAGLGGSKGIAQICAVGYELKWEAGRLYVMNGNGNAIRSSLYNFNIVPTINDDDTKAYYVGSLWSLDNGDVYECTDSTTGAAVWELKNTGTTPTLQQVTDEGNTITTTSSITTLGEDAVSVFDVNLPEFGASIGAYGLFVNGDTNQTSYQYNKIIYVDEGTSKNLQINYPGSIISTNKVQTFQDADGTIALLSDIPSGGVTSVGLTMPSAFTVTNSPITSSGDIAVTGAGLVSQYVRGDGTLANFPNSTGGGASVSYYLNGSVSQGTIGGVAYKEMNGVPIIGTGTDFTINADGYIAQFITDAGDPNKLLIPAGNWNFETYFSASSVGGSPQFYIELYKYNGTTFTLIASNSATPENITGGTSIDLYFTALAVPPTVLLATDRLAVRFYVIHSGRTITMHTENSHLSQIITTFTTGLTALNGLTQQVQFFDVGTGATNFNISSSGDTHTFNLLFNIRRNANNSSNNNINYNGYAVTGSAESSAVWTITRLTISASGSITVATATNVAWTNRESAIYT